MIEQRVASVRREPEVAASKLGYFRYEELPGGKYVLTNDPGEWHLLSRDDFRTFLKGEIDESHPEYDGLQSKGFIRRAMDLTLMAEKLRRKRYYLDYGPHLHGIITTLRCNQACKYCHASRTEMDRFETDMSIETALKAVDLAFESTNPYICFEYTGGEPTVNMPVIKACVEYANKKNEKIGKIVDHSVVTNMTWMNEENAEWLIDHGVLVCTSLDGPEDLHNWNRTWIRRDENMPVDVDASASNAYQNVLKWMRYFNRRYVEMGKDPGLWHVDALMTTTRKSLDYAKELVDLWVDLGIRNIKIRPLNPYGFATKTWKVIGYSADEYEAFYKEVLDYVIELNMKGVEIQEGTAALFLKKMLTPDDPNYVDIRSPIGSGTGQISYNIDGRIYPSDEGRMVAGMGSDFFEIGVLGESTYAEVVRHPTVRALAVSSLVDSLPGCSTCFNAPYCGVRPINNYMESGDLFAQRPRTPKCREHKNVVKLLFQYLANDEDGRIEAVFHRWTISRPRDED